MSIIFPPFGRYQANILVGQDPDKSQFGPWLPSTQTGGMQEAVNALPNGGSIVAKGQITINNTININNPGITIILPTPKDRIILSSSAPASIPMIKVNTGANGFQLRGYGLLDGNLANRAVGGDIGIDIFGYGCYVETQMINVKGGGIQVESGSVENIIIANIYGCASNPLLLLAGANFNQIILTADGNAGSVLVNSNANMGLIFATGTSQDHGISIAGQNNNLDIHVDNFNPSVSGKYALFLNGAVGGLCRATFSRIGANAAGKLGWTALVAPYPKVILDQPLGFSITTPAMPASGVAQSNTFPFPVIVYLYGGTVTQITVNGQVVFSSGTGISLTGQSFTLNPGDSIAITYTAAPTWKWYGL